MLGAFRVLATPALVYDLIAMEIINAAIAVNSTVLLGLVADRKTRC
jgi:hypothetical protein